MSCKICLISLIKEHTVFIQHAQNRVAGSIAGLCPETGRFESFTDAKELLKALPSSFAHSKVVTVCADRSRYLYLKKLLFQALSLESETSAAVSAAIQSNGDDVSAETAAAHSIFPKGASVFVSEDGLFSGFAVRSGKQHLVVLPLDLERLDSIIENGFAAYMKSALAAEEIPATFSAEPDASMGITKKMIVDGFCAAIAATRSAEFIKIKLAPVSGWENAFIFVDCDENKNETTQKEYVANLALQARERAGCSVGAAISNVYTSDKEDGALFVLVTVADNLRARVAKVYAQPGETPRQLVMAAVDNLLDMLGEYAETDGFTGFPLSVQEPGILAEDSKSKSRIALKLILSGIAAVILCLIIIFFGGRMAIAVKDFSGRLINGNQKQTATIATTDASTEAESSKTSIDDLLSMLADMPSYSVEETEATGAEDTTQTTTARQESTAVTTGKTSKTTVKPSSPTTKTTNKPSTTKTTTKPASTTTAKTTRPPVTTAKTTTTIKTTIATTKAPTTHQTSTTTVPIKPTKTVSYNGTSYGLTEYLARTVAAEMGTSENTHIEAYKAQVVAAYTFAKKYNYTMNSNHHALSTSFNMNPNTKVMKAVTAVAGKYLSYNGSPVATFYFTSSAGQTVSSASVWGGSIPYLQGGVSSPETVQVSSRSYTANEFKALVDEYNNKNPSKAIQLQVNPADWIQIKSADSAGYVNTVKVGNKEMSGNTFRYSLLKLGIKSHCFTAVYKPTTTSSNPSQYAGTFNFTVKGYGHGVGMSQKGAIEYANQGWTYDKILLHYYQPGVKILNDT